MGTSIFRAMLLASVSVTAAVGVAPVAAQAQEQSYDIDIPAQSLGDAIRALGRSTRQTIVFDGSTVRGKRSVAVRGRMTPAEALERMLAGSNLVMAKNSSGSLTVRVGNGQGGAELASSSGEDAGSEGRDSGVEGGKGISEILVVGSRTQNVDIRRTEDDPQPYVIIDRKAIERTGATDVASLLRSQLTAAATTGLSSQFATGVNGNATTINLRNLGAEDTLVLVNGRRIASFNTSGFSNQPDLNGIPISAIERVQILPSTASGIYGGGATGGVVNIILRRDYSGAELRVQYGNTLRNDAENRQIDFSFGKSLFGGRTQVQLSASYADNEPLTVGDRSFTTRARQLILRNNPALINNASSPPMGYTTNICSGTTFCNGTPLTLKLNNAPLGSSFTSVPVGYLGTATDGGVALIANAGRYNLDLADTASVFGSRRTLMGGPRIWSINGSIRQEITSRIEAFVEFAASGNRNHTVLSVATTDPSFTLAASAPNNPFNQAIRVTTPIFGLDREYTTDLESRRIVGGIIARLPFGWSLNLENTWAASRNDSDQAGGALVNFAPADVTSGVLDVLRDTNLSRPDFGAYLPTAPLGGVSPTKTRLINPALRLSGALPFGLPGGKPTMTLGAEYRRENLAELVTPTLSVLGSTTLNTTRIYPARHQSAKSAYGELLLPVLAEGNRIPAIRELDLQFSLRYDDFTTVAANSYTATTVNPQIVRINRSWKTANPTVGFRWQPVDGIRFRGSFATGFLAPTMNQLVPTADQPRNLTFSNLRDPRRGNEPIQYSVVILNGGSEDLKPERARSMSLGVIFEPRFVSGLRLSADANWIRKRGNIGALPISQDALNQEQFISGLITRAAPTAANDPNNYGVGPISIYSARLFNIAEQHVRAYDFKAEYSRNFEGFGTLGFSARATWTTRLDEKVAPAAPEQSRLKFASSPEWTAVGTVYFENDSWDIALQTQYLDGYFVQQSHAIDLSQGSATIRRQIYSDLHIGYKFVSRDPGLNGLSMFFNVQNIFDAQPPLVVAAFSGASPYSASGDPRLARYTVGLKKAF